MFVIDAQRMSCPAVYGLLGGILLSVAQQSFAASAPIVVLQRSERAAIKPAATDPFKLPALAPAIATKPSLAALPAPAASLVPIAPAFQLSFLGRMQTTDGRTLVMAQAGDGRTFNLELGKVLSSGYRVERIGTDVVELLHPQTQSVVLLPMPPVPRFETR